MSALVFRSYLPARKSRRRRSSSSKCGREKSGWNKKYQFCSRNEGEKRIGSTLIGRGSSMWPDPISQKLFFVLEFFSILVCFVVIFVCCVSQCDLGRNNKKDWTKMTTTNLVISLFEKWVAGADKATCDAVVSGTASADDLLSLGIFFSILNGWAIVGVSIWIIPLSHFMY